MRIILFIQKIFHAKLAKKKVILKNIME